MEKLRAFLRARRPSRTRRHDRVGERGGIRQGRACPPRGPGRRQPARHLRAADRHRSAAVASAVREALATTPARRRRRSWPASSHPRRSGEPGDAARGKVPSYASPKRRRSRSHARWNTGAAAASGSDLPDVPRREGPRPQGDLRCAEKAIGSFWLDAGAVRRVLSAYGIRMPQTEFAEDGGRRLASRRSSARRRGEARVAHAHAQTDVGGVKLTSRTRPGTAGLLRHPGRAEDARQGKGDGGVVVQEMAPQAWRRSSA